LLIIGLLLIFIITLLVMILCALGDIYKEVGKEDEDNEEV